jgi:hypothetical protein
MARHDTDRRTFYFPGLRMLSRAEIDTLPEGKRKAAEASGEPGVWLEVPCPKEACFKGKGKVCIDTLAAEREEREGLWMRVFCPEDSCLATGGTDLP